MCRRTYTLKKLTVEVALPENGAGEHLNALDFSNNVTLCMTVGAFCLFWEQQHTLPVGHGFLIHEVSRSHSKEHHSR